MSKRPQELFNTPLPKKYASVHTMFRDAKSQSTTALLKSQIACSIYANISKEFKNEQISSSIQGVRDDALQTTIKELSFTKKHLDALKNMCPSMEACHEEHARSIIVDAIRLYQNEISKRHIRTSASESCIAQYIIGGVYAFLGLVFLVIKLFVLKPPSE